MQDIFFMETWDSEKNKHLQQIPEATNRRRRASIVCPLEVFVKVEVGFLSQEASQELE